MAPCINPFTAPACKLSGLKDAQMHMQTVYFPVLYLIYFQCYVFLWNSIRMPVWKRKQKRLQVSGFALLLVIFKGHHGSEGEQVPLCLIL